MKKLLVLLGPTGVGKTELSVSLAEYWNCPIISADSRQLYKGLSIGTAAPTEIQLSRVPHYMVGTLGIEEYYSASEFETDSLKIISQLHQTNDILIVTGGSMMYIDALCKGIDEVPTIDENLRKEIYDRYEKEGLEPIRSQLKILDPVFYDQVDLKNYKRVIHALEVCLMSGKPYSSFRTNTVKQRPFEIIKIGLMRNRDELYQRINLRVDKMMEDGLLAEAERFYPFRINNSLNTVGYKELFKYLDGQWTLDFAIEKIKQNSRIYSRKQMTWFKRDTSINWIDLSEISQEIAFQQIQEKVL
ncbi:tRNA (adenosine(37)-N6)-dimethylallyltransferase MiaA [Dysgonomonas sp. HDW5B]|uniref:tRNA (adenosine(37)-N6)-dimethylallyltransferase MiaA n=1 Tax=Dysgonomonas sp. HDW5B TaxID=2714927 RepID=UPI00140B2F25|nr:tRNA (adenosine(37)-N6)-dimethylallyltransferase MiaA [Dysgonomonas sp. HDW5B]QIK56003.1 tRNA (adenosine(37)-N6)-dimethylallyltransferase MiaA [Dysgonomonas sp. HDW5B]